MAHIPQLAEGNPPPPKDAAWAGPMYDRLVIHLLGEHVARQSAPPRLLYPRMDRPIDEGDWLGKGSDCLAFSDRLSTRLCPPMDACPAYIIAA